MPRCNSFNFDCVHVAEKIALFNKLSDRSRIPLNNCKAHLESSVNENNSLRKSLENGELEEEVNIDRRKKKQVLKRGNPLSKIRRPINELKKERTEKKLDYCEYIDNENHESSEKLQNNHVLCANSSGSQEDLFEDNLEINLEALFLLHEDEGKAVCEIDMIYVDNCYVNSCPESANPVEDANSCGKNIEDEKMSIQEIQANDVTEKNCEEKTQHLKKIKSGDLWAEHPRVQSSEIFKSLSKDKKKLQEAIYEIFKSEMSYNCDLNALKSVYIRYAKLFLSENDYQMLTDTFLPLQHFSDNFLTDLEIIFEKDILLNGIFQSLLDYIWNSRTAFLNYAKQYEKINGKVDSWFERKDLQLIFTELCKNHPGVKKLPVHGYLLLPLQRLTRLPLLIDNVLKYLKEDDKRFSLAKSAQLSSQKVARECNDELENIRRFKVLTKLHNALIFESDVPSFLIFSSTRHLLLQSSVRCCEKKIKMEFFLFNDMFVLGIPKLQNDREIFHVKDYCSRENLRVRGEKGKPGKLVAFTLLLNAKNVRSDYSVIFKDNSHRERWIYSLWPEELGFLRRKIGTENVKLFVLTPYIAQKPDELTIYYQDQLCALTENLNDWAQVFRPKDLAIGWVPVACCAVLPQGRKCSLNLHRKTGDKESNPQRRTY